MPFVDTVSTVQFPDKVDQQEVKRYVRELFYEDFPAIDRMLPAFDNTAITSRNFCMPLDYYSEGHSFEENNEVYVQVALDYSIRAIEACLQQANIDKHDITDLIFISSTGLATPSLDALIINKMQLNPHIGRTPVFGLGCAGGASGMAKACTIAKANPHAVVALVAVELCSLTFLRKDISKSNFIATSLFSDGIAACIIKGDAHAGKQNVTYTAAQSRLYYDSLDVMGWQFLNSGFKVVFSQDIPTIINKNVKQDIVSFLSKQGMELRDVQNFIFHPGGTKVLAAYEDALGIEGDFLNNTRQVMNDNGNMSSVTVLYVLEKFIREGFKDGPGLMMALGPGFSSEMVLLDMHNG